MLVFLQILQIIASLFLTILILLQSRNAGLTSGVKNNFSAYRSIRGLEKVVFVSTIVLGCFLVINSLLMIAL